MKIIQPVFKYNGLAEDSDICLQSSKTLDLDKPISPVITSCLSAFSDSSSSKGPGTHSVGAISDQKT